MKYYIYQVKGWLKSQNLATESDFNEVLESLPKDAYGLREVSKAEYNRECDYNSSPGNPWNR